MSAPRIGGRHRCSLAASPARPWREGRSTLCTMNAFSSGDAPSTPVSHPSPGPFLRTAYHLGTDSSRSLPRPWRLPAARQRDMIGRTALISVRLPLVVAKASVPIDLASSSFGRELCVLRPVNAIVSGD